MRRIRCAVPFCRRTRPGALFEWICSKHWALVPRHWRRDYARARRRARSGRCFDCYGAGACGCARNLWRMCKAEAIERAAGL